MDKAPSAPFPHEEDTMTTPRIRSLVSLAAALTFTVVLGGCVSAPAHATSNEPAPTDELPRTVRFDNEARDYVHVYLVAARQEWLLGRVAPGGRATLRIPEAALTEDVGLVSLAVIAGDRVTLRAAREVGAATTIGQPAADMLSQRWTFSTLTATGQLTSLRLVPSRTAVGHQ
ncbi:MAG: hypothetical protein JWL95_759 [Gemmatimonadetes bacterium]|nr:hypothetical protein [Gemmatimonadota bacterium]